MNYNEAKKKWKVVFGISILILLIYFILHIFSSKKSTTTVLVQTPFYTGQGIVYECNGNEAYIVTAAHVLDGMDIEDSCIVFLSQDYQMQAEVKYISETADVAFLVINLKQNVNDNIDALKFKAVKMDRAHFDALKEESPVFAYSYNGLDMTKIAGSLISPWIYLEDFNLDMMLAKLPCIQGMSGCGVFDDKGFFVGIICGSNKEEAAILPFSIIESEWIMVKD